MSIPFDQEVFDDSGERTITPVALRTTETHIWAGYSDGTVCIFDHLVNKLVSHGHFHSTPIVCFTVCEDNTVISASDDGVLVHWDVEEKRFEAITRVMSTSDKTHGTLTCVTHAGIANTVFCGYSSGIIFAVDVESGNHTNDLKGHSKRINDLSVCGDFLFSCSDDSIVGVWSNRLINGLTVAANKSGKADCKLLKRISVSPTVKSFLADVLLKSLWVVYADGLIERWSTNPDDDFGVEEVIRDALGVSQGGASPQEVVSMHSITSMDTLQVLALSSNGVNKVWYGHNNALEEKMARSIHELNEIITCDTNDTAVWRERMNLLRQKEMERKQKYIVIMEQLSEQRVLLRFYESWKRRVVMSNLRKNRGAMADFLAKKIEYATIRTYFTSWAAFYDQQQTHLRRYHLANALADALQRQETARLFIGWRHVVQRKKAVRRSTEMADSIGRLVDLKRLADFYHRWVLGRRSRQLTEEERQAYSRKMELLAERASRQTVSRVFSKWSAFVQVKSSERENGAALVKYANLYAKMVKHTQTRSYFHVWRNWLLRKKSLEALDSVATLQGRQMNYGLQERYLHQWICALYKAKVDKRQADIMEIQQKLTTAEQENADVFERLQLQKQISSLTEAVEAEQLELEVQEKKVEQLQPLCDAAKKDLESPNVRFPTAVTDKPARGVMTTYASWFFQLVDQQRLSPAILTQMSLNESTQHVFVQLKGNVLNMYTDINLFRQVYDKRKAGTSAAALFLEAFGEIKRLVVLSTKPQGKGMTGKKNCRWALCMEALDSIFPHHWGSVLCAIKTLIISFDILTEEDMDHVNTTCEEVVTNADWIFLIARACYINRKPILPVNNRDPNV
ncbi:hypothetical protein AGDE_13947 [Angomonas deanei]|uniref:Uncharacterized protein n=1 Tax=Angomonas deanei TaxID=59799 RepID=A0A7G2CLS4_9TRYP|nr:hypothetical protein AGDE_13947 [Angomonas deanei]CAD2220017.1 hypothetical protein, conserved [Angomonas deanei]|eukprot:EPY21605.1 hypothetical protein AGDE_13947 [Angomonas deanei]